MIPIAKPIIGEDDRAAIERVLGSGILANGEECLAFESEFAAFLGARHAVAVNSGTTALVLALRLLKESTPGGRKDEVIVPAMSFNATSAAVILAGLRPVFVDVNGHGLIAADKVRRARTNKTLGVIGVDLYGRMADYNALNALGIPIIEDASQAHGAYDPRWVIKPGSRAMFEKYCRNMFATTFSFYATKNMTTGGEGGAVVVNHASRETDLRMYRDNGALAKYVHLVTGGNYRMTEMQAAMGRSQLKHLDSWVERRRQNADLYDAFLGIDQFMFEKPENREGHAWHQYVIRVPGGRREEVQEALALEGIQTAVHYPVADPYQPVYGYTRGSFPHAALLAEEALSIPVGPWVTPSDVGFISSSLNVLAAKSK